MKKVVYMIAALAFAACGNKTNNAAIQKELTDDLREDSIARVKFVADSLKKNKNDSLALIAWGDTRQRCLCSLFCSELPPKLRETENKNVYNKLIYNYL